MRAICSGTTISPTMTTKMMFRPGNSIQAKA